jgi:TolB-like protein/DNA-binding winged helix-turn-helix (wHTH) protein
MSRDNAQVSERYAFAGFTLDPARQVLQGPHGEIRLRPKSYALLLYLVHHQGRLVTRQELHDALWGRLAVTDDSLTQCLVEVRRALGDQGRRIVQTVPRRGYLFEAPVMRLPADELQVARSRATDSNAEEDRGADAADDGEVDVPAGGSSPSSPRGALYTTGILAIIAVAAMLVVWMAAHREPVAPDSPDAVEQRLPNSIAVLPFVDMSADKDQEYFGDGIAEEILNLLAQSPELKVIARTSSFAFKNRSVDIPTISRELGVGHVLEGSVRNSGNRMRITAQLITAADGAHLWSRSYDRELGDLLGVQREIAAEVAGALKTSLLGDGRSGPVVDARAYDHFLRGRFLFHRRDPGDLDRAREQFEAAVALEPGYAPAWADLSGVYNAQVYLGEIPREIGLQRRREAAEQALALDPGLPEAHLRAGTVFFDDGDVERARRHLDLARALDPDNPLLLGLTSGFLLAEGRIDEAIQHWDRIVANDPLSRMSRQNRALHLMAAGRLEEARADLLVVRDLGGAAGVPDTFLSLVLVLEERHEEALALLGPAPISHDRDVGLALAHRGLGNIDEFEAVIAGLQADGSGQAAVALANIRAHLGEREDAFRWLTEARARLQGDTRWDSRGWARALHISPFLRPLHDDPRWAALYTQEWPAL